MSLVEHKKARLNFDILKEFEAGLELHGFEVKSLRAGHGKLEGAHIVVRPSGKRGGYEAYLVGANIPPYQAANTPPDYEPERPRRLLLAREELGELADSEKQKGLTIVPIAVYNKGRHLKLKLAVARGRKKFDKRAVLKERDTKRDIERTLKNQ